METLTLMLRLYELLAESSASDLSRAARAAGDTTIGQALRLLADYRREHGGVVDPAQAAIPIITKNDIQITRPPQKRSDSLRSSQSGIPVGLERQLRDMILSKRHIQRTSDLLEFIKQSGLAIKATNKDARVRIYNKVIKALLHSSENTKVLVTKKLLSKMGASETSRWFDVIRKEE